MRWRYGLALGAALVLLGLVAWQVALNIQRYRADSEALARSWERIELLRSLQSELREAESAQRGLVLTGNPSFQRAFEASEFEARELADRLASALAGDRERSTRAAELLQLVNQRLEVSRAHLELYLARGLEAAREEIGKAQGTQIMAEFSVQSTALAGAERDTLAARRDDSERSLARLMLVSTGGLALAVLVLLALFGTLLAENRQRAAAEREAERASEELRASVGELHQLAERTAALSHYAGMLQSCDSVDEAVEQTRDLFQRLLPDHGAAVYLLRASHDHVERVARWGELPAASGELFVARECWALRRGQPYRLELSQPGSRCAHVEAPAPGTRGTVLCAPLVAQGETLGLVYAGGPSGPLLEAVVLPLAEQLSLAVANLRLRETLRRQSIRDPLTGLFNRRYLEESLARELARCGRRQLPLAVIMLDIDHFKAFNDGEGHDAGDALLQGVAEVLRASCRGEDIACRYGGEEFTLILPEMDARSARVRGEEVRQRIAALRVGHLGRVLPGVTASLGLALFPSHGVGGSDLLRAADAALYRAKAAGRDRLLEA